MMIHKGCLYAVGHVYKSFPYKRLYIILVKGVSMKHIICTMKTKYLYIFLFQGVMPDSHINAI